MESFEIYWDDLTPQAQKRLKSLYHDNIDLSPLAIVDIESEDRQLILLYFHSPAVGIGAICYFIKLTISKEMEGATD